MAQSILSTIRKSIKYWWLLLLTGIVFVAMGFWVFLTPLATYLALSILFAVNMIVSGIFEIFFSVSNRDSIEGWGWMLAGGILDLVLGIYLAAYPAVTMVILPFIVGFWLMFRGAMAIGTAITFKSVIGVHPGWLIFLGIISIIFAILIMLNPAFGVLNIVIWTALAFITLGISSIINAFRLRKLKKVIEP